MLRLGAPKLFGEGAPDLSGLDIQRVEEELPQLIFQWSTGGDIIPSFLNKTKHLLYVPSGCSQDTCNNKNKNIIKIAHCITFNIFILRFIS